MRVLYHFSLLISPLFVLLCTHKSCSSHQTPLGLPDPVVVVAVVVVSDPGQAELLLQLPDLGGHGGTRAGAAGSGRAERGEGAGLLLQQVVSGRRQQGREVGAVGTPLAA